MKYNLLKLLGDLQSRHIYLDSDKLAPFTLRQTPPFALVEPDTVEAAVALLHACYREKGVVNVWGSGLHQNIGGLPSPFDIVLSSRGLNRLIEFSPENLTITAQTGMTLAELQQIVTASKLFAPLNPPNAGHATLGGLAAANSYGSFIQGFGSLRDFMLGGKAILADGSYIKFGGKTVKNVAGYDMCKLFIGSMGTLGLLTEVTLKLWPLPENIIVAKPVVKNLPDFENLAAILHHKALPLLAADCSFNLHNGDIDNLQLHYAFYTTAALDEGYLNYLRRLFPADTIWQKQGYKDYQAEPGSADNFFKTTPHDLVLEWIVPKSQLFTIIADLQQASNDLSGAIEFYGYPAAGIFYNKLKRSSFTEPGAFALALDKWRKKIHQAGGFLQVNNAPDDIKIVIEMWDLPPAVLAWQKKIKLEYDPTGVFAGGRFAGGI
ncbi:MAG TPA: FAD-binding oxidoreductase [bacterium]|nr:FAD-binding oxidoreductase [bacterium]HPN43676.1 FAD-binding oxidoreductase [bacterium]